MFIIFLRLQFEVCRSHYEFLLVLNFKITFAGHAHIRHWAALIVHSSWAHHFIRSTKRWAKRWAAVLSSPNSRHAEVWQWATGLGVHATWAHHFLGSTFRREQFWASRSCGGQESQSDENVHSEC